MELKTTSSKTETTNDDAKPRKRKNPFRETKEDRQRRQKKRSRLIIRNISYKTNEDAIRTHFAPWGNVEDINILKRPDGKLVGCAFIQYESVNQATKAILNTNGKEMLGRTIYVDWAVGKDQYKKPKLEVNDDIKSENDSLDVKEESGDEEEDVDGSDNDQKPDIDQEDDSQSDAASDENSENEEEMDSDCGTDEDTKDEKLKQNIEKLPKTKHISNDVVDGCTIFVKNVPFDAEDEELRKLCRKYGPVYYAIINRQAISGHSKGTAFVKFKSKESADLCIQSGPEFMLNDQTLEVFPALSKEEIANQRNAKEKEQKDGKDSRNLYLAREGLIMANSKAAEGVSATDMAKRHKLEQIKSQVLKNLNRFVSRNRLSIHNLPIHYDNEKLKQMLITHTGYRPHECRVMRENKITAEYPLGKSKGFGFMSFSTHQEALTALRKLNNNPKIFNAQSRPIVAFSIEDRAVHKIKEKRKEKSKLNNPNYKEKLEKRKEMRKLKAAGKLSKAPTTDSKEKLRKHIKKLEESRAAKLQKTEARKEKDDDNEDKFVGTAAKFGTNLHLRSNKKIQEQARDHRKNVKVNKRKEKQKKIRQIHLAERKAQIRPKQGRKKPDVDNLSHLVEKYKNMLSSSNQVSSSNNNTSVGKRIPKKSKWYKE